MKKTIIALCVIVCLIGSFFGAIYINRYQTALDWIEVGAFSKATSYLDEFPFITELHDSGLVDYAYAGEAMEYGHFDEAIALLIPLAEANYRDSVQMLEECMENAK